MRWLLIIPSPVKKCLTVYTLYNVQSVFYTLRSASLPALRAFLGPDDVEHSHGAHGGGQKGRPASREAARGEGGHGERSRS